MNYTYADINWNRMPVRVIRIDGGKNSTGAQFFDTDLPEPSESLTTHDLYYLEKLRGQNEAEKRLVYFDIDSAQVEHSTGLKGFEEYYEDYKVDNLEWHIAMVNL